MRKKAFKTQREEEAVDRQCPSPVIIEQPRKRSLPVAFGPEPANGSVLGIPVKYGNRDRKINRRSIPEAEA
jgi:hypothetical protein